jgi:4-diphosphocytidyl-2-C-methyl-D-erythritol kinase
MLKGLNQLFDLNLSQHELKELAATLGSDCAFFIEDKPALATGKGEQLEGIEIALPGKFLVVVTPPVQVDTGAAYSMLTPKKSAIDLSEALKSLPGHWSGSITNDFEGPVFETYPAIGQIKDTLLGAGAVYASMTGSGSSVYGFFDEERDFEGRFGEGYLVWAQELDFLPIEI